MTGAQLNSEFRPYYTVQNNYMVWHDYAVIKLNYLFESLNKIGLVKRVDAQLRLWVNTGTVNVSAGGAVKEAEGRAGTLRFTQRSSNTL
jgi:hypothetical protein